MSHWTLINASLIIETGILDKNVKGVMEEILQKAPQITGSEGNADVFVNVPSGHDYYTSCDCSHCPFGHTRKTSGGSSQCCSPEEYECKEGEFQTTIAISIIGNLRDRFLEETEKEYKDLVEWINERFSVVSDTHSIIGDKKDE